jgi:Putative transposase
MKECFQAAFDNNALVPGMITGIHSSGKVLNFHPHVHAVTSAGCFDKDGTFHRISCMPDEEQLAKLFMHKVLKMMMSLDKIDENVGERLTSWTYSGFVLMPNLCTNA